MSAARPLRRTKGTPATTSDRSSLPAWDLTDLYRGVDDPRIERDLKRAERDAQAFAKRYRGKLAKLAQRPRRMLAALQEFERVRQQLALPYVFAELRFSEVSTDPARGAFLQRMQARVTQIGQQLLFFELELLALPAAALRALARAPQLEGYGYYLSRLAAYRRHRLGEEQERLLHDLHLTGRDAFVRLFSEEHSAKKFVLTRGARREELSETELLRRLHDPSRATRRAAADALSKGLAADSRRMSMVYNTLVLDKATEDRYRQFATPEAARHLENGITQEMVDAMVSVVVEHYPLVQRFYRFKRRVMGVDELFDYDRYAPVRARERRYSYEQAKQMVLEAFERFSPEYASVAERFFSRNWIDFAKRQGKRGGAYCHPVTPTVHPYVFMNFNGTLQEVFTLAHELGHAIHFYLMREQSYLNYDTPLTVAETASVFAEMLLFDHLRQQLTDPGDLFALYVKKIEDTFATCFRQISMYRFEQRVHQSVRASGELLPEQFNELWRASQQEMFGRAVTLREGYHYWWSYIPHFIHTPFYVYAYAFGELLTLSLFARYQQRGEAFVPRYLAMLAKGGSEAPSALMAPLGINLRSPGFWREGVALIESMVEEAQRLYRKTVR